MDLELHVPLALQPDRRFGALRAPAGLVDGNVVANELPSEKRLFRVCVLDLAVIEDQILVFSFELSKLPLRTQPYLVAVYPVSSCQLLEAVQS